MIHKLTSDVLAPNAASPSRVLDIDGRFNFRDLGGYETEHGQRVRWRRIFRSGVMAHISESGFETLSSLGIRCICDLRTTHERQHSRTRWELMGATDYWCRDYDNGSGDIARFMARTDQTAEVARRAMIDDYRRLPFDQAAGYAELFRRIAEGHVPLVFNCTAGKDRTGTGAAILLTLLGVPRSVIVDDYVLTNETLRNDAPVLVQRGHLATWKFDDAFEPLVRAEGDYLDAMFKALEQECGSVEQYLKDLGIDSAQQQAIRTELLESP